MYTSATMVPISQTPLTTSLLASLRTLKDWSPFSIDALGLVTMLGGNEVDIAVGRLVQNPYAEFLPMLGAYVFANDHFTAQLPGFALYNITDSIMTTEVKGWLVRWLKMQNLRTSTSCFTWNIERSPQSGFLTRNMLALAIGTISTAPLLVLTILMGDWFGLCNVVAMVVSVIVRWFLLLERRNGLDAGAKRAVSKGRESGDQDIVKVLVALDDGKLVSMSAPRGVVRQCFTRQADLLHPAAYKFARGAGWSSFAVHAIALGMSSLFTQIYTVVLMLSGTLLACYGVGCNEQHITPRIRAKQQNIDRDDKRMWAFVYMDMTRKEEAVMEHWSLLPRRSNQGWWTAYAKAKEKLVEEQNQIAAVQ
ncbi:uncharacterized protein GIQ15_04606 [Arthroderma uncinatum]|uniref:uncharacterized protein n=1 Tax=Arthroderma uncinatum TaxID=74035 RepID=UPI00144A96D9|nr:uncharacterized protein GIQ15_04606 [Arthroderma uncinatum]KAF3481847.1 hypothetical protein GIQ15_04606 [Arthroderma uncinatum]